MLYVLLTVSQVEVVNSEVVAGELRYEVLVHQSYKNTVPLLHKEFLWIPDPCQCPRLRLGLTYLVMGTTDNTKGREVRLVLPRHSYVRRFKARNLARILRVRHNEMRFCRPWRRDLRFLLPRPSQQGPEEREELEQGQSSVLLKNPEDLQHEDHEKTRHEHLRSHQNLTRNEHDQLSSPLTHQIGQEREHSQYQHHQDIPDREGSSLYQHREEESSPSHQYDQGEQPGGSNQEGEVKEPLQHLGQDGGGRSALRDDQHRHHLRPHQEYDHFQREQNNGHEPREEDQARNHISQGQNRGYDRHPPGQHLGVDQHQQQPGDLGRHHSTHDPREPDCERDQEHKSHHQKPHSDPTQHPGEQTDHKHQKQDRKGVHWLRRWQEYRRRYIHHHHRQRQRHRVQSYHHHHTAAAPREREDNRILSEQGSI